MLYVPILRFLQLLLSNSYILDTALDNQYRNEDKKEVYMPYRDGVHFKCNNFMSGSELRILLNWMILRSANRLAHTEKKL